MKALLKLLGLSLALLILGLTPAPATAKYFPCDFPGSCVPGSPNTPCSCPEGTPNHGASVTCGNQGGCYL